VSARDEQPIDPREVSTWTPSKTLELLDRWESSLPGRAVEDLPSAPATEAIVIGDTHADWPTTEYLAARYLEGPEAAARWIALGDYVDRTPRSLPHGSLRNALFLLSLRAAFPDRVTLLRGNHETQRAIPAGMTAVADEARQLWGEPTVAERVQDLFDRLPLAARTESGAYLAHAGFPMDRPIDWREDIATGSERVLLEVVWNDVEGSPACGQRGIEQEPIRASNLERFFVRSDCRVFVRGHDPDIAGQFRFDHRLLTVHTTRVFERAGLTMARIPLDGRISRLAESHLLRLPFPPLPARRS
jgi:hypothetical protein